MIIKPKKPENTEKKSSASLEEWILYIVFFQLTFYELYLFY